jgi:UDP-N-acetyl-D-glucosamine/UDP-N-acetyl-D-galactosamine dehydrogenase
MTLKNKKIGILGMGYVGLPLALAFSKKYKTIGYDISAKRVRDLNNNIDNTNEVSFKQLEKLNNNLIFTNKKSNLISCNCFIITVPTPIDIYKKPNLKPLFSASKIVGKYLKKNDIVIYESTVYPGVTEDECSKVLEFYSKLKYNKDFFLGYSPERINPGDKKHSIAGIVKITSGSNKKTAEVVDSLYKSIIKAGTHKVKSIKVAEAAKVIENTQRDVNIALINELSIIFNKLGVDTEDVLRAAGTKWNFLPFKPGLVGGHCIGVDPYYLTHKAKKLNYNPAIILAGRKINDQMSHYVVNNLSKALRQKKILLKKSRILIMGLTFKENCPDIRNSKVIDIAKNLHKKGSIIECYDPWVRQIDNINIRNIKFISFPKKSYYDCILLAVAHNNIKKIGINTIRGFAKSHGIIYDLKHIFPKDKTDIRL